MGTFSIETSVSSRDFLCLRLQRLRTSSDTVSRAAEQTKEPFHSRNTINYTPAICISYIHHCTCTSTPLSCSYTLGNVQIKSKSLKRILFPIQLQWEDSQVCPHMSQFPCPDHWKLDCCQAHTGVFTPRHLQPPWRSPRAAEDMLGWQSPQSPKNLPDVSTLPTLLSTS